MNDRLVWIDCEMTGLDHVADALIEVAALVTDFELNLLGEGVDLVIKPPAEALEQMVDFVRDDARHASGLLAELDSGITLADAEQQVLAYVREHCAEPRKAAAGRQLGGHRPRRSSSRDMPALEAHLHYRIVDVSSIKELARRWYPRAYFASPAKKRQPPSARRHPGEHRGAAVLPGGRLRAAARPGPDSARAAAAEHARPGAAAGSRTPVRMPRRYRPRG